MLDYEPSEYQKKILEAIENSNDNLLIEAKAGSGKTSTLIMIADLIKNQGKNCLFVAFNKSIVTELQTKIFSSHCQINTLHSLGLSFLRSFLYKKHKENYELNVDTTEEQLKGWVDELFSKILLESFTEANKELNPTELKDLLYEVKTDIRNLINYCRLYNINYHDSIEVYKLANRLCYSLREAEEIGVNDYPQIIELCIDKIKEQFMNPELTSDGKFYYNITYTDMIYFPCLYDMYPPYKLRDYLDYVMIDELQDLSVLQQKFIKLCCLNNTRVIGVGDRNQSIYAFAGADVHSIDNFKKNFTLRELPLNICYRCPKRIITLAQQLVPSIEYNKKRPDAGVVNFIYPKEIGKYLKPGDIIIGRRNKDLVRLYKKLVLDEKIQVKFKNVEMVNSIVKEIIKNVNEYKKRYNKGLNIQTKLREFAKEYDIDLDKPDIMDKLSDSEKDLLSAKSKDLIKLNLASKTISKSNLTIDYLIKCMEEYKDEGFYNYAMEGEEEYQLVEYYDVIMSLIEYFISIKGTNLLFTDFKDFIEDFLKGNLEKRVPILSSVHMMKGSEADNVFIYDYPRFPYTYSSQTEDTRQQEYNLQYVAITRAKRKLFLCYIDRPNVPRETIEDIEKINNNCSNKIYKLLDQKIGFNGEFEIV